MSKVYMGQIMAECDCRHSACEHYGYCMADRIEQLAATNEELSNCVAVLEAKLAKAVWRFEHLEKYGDTDAARDFAADALAELKGQGDD